MNNVSRIKVAIITSGAGGIGSTIVDQFITEGAKVISADITKIKLKKGPRFLYGYKRLSFSQKPY